MAKADKRQRQTKSVKESKRQGAPVDKKLDGPNRPST
ncbi:hypothetical protein Pryu01_00361 [Paraliobacillus ryukyuensis]|uniref:Uncharacterized protein n=1 Tax=Paraliobacillus ryukyuensis TaxID=200904 RepID=A0A366EGP5_9BACI|nr:hypothetical protein DES48_101304 [Paraliobacillus ryukyuensis]